MTGSVEDRRGLLVSVPPSTHVINGTGVHYRFIVQTIVK